MTLNQLIGLTSTLTISVILSSSAGVKAQTQTSECPPGAQQCLLQQYQEQNQYNQQLNFRTPQQTNQYFRERTANTCAQENTANCSQLETQVEMLQDRDPAFQLQELRQQQLNDLLSK
jgi:hypothetical protein